jgi:pilus assembly protein TadC
MKNIINKFKRLDTLYKGGVIFITLFFIPVVVCLINDLIKNGSNLL